MYFGSKPQSEAQIADCSTPPPQKKKKTGQLNMISSHFEALWNNLHPTHQNQTSNPSTPQQVLVLLYLSAGMRFAKNMASLIPCKTWRSYRVQDHQGKKKETKKNHATSKKKEKNSPLY